MSNNDEVLIRGEVWLADLEPRLSGELSRARLIVIVSVTRFNNGPADLLLVLPITTRRQDIPTHVLVSPPEGGLSKDGYILCEQLQCMQRNRLLKRLGNIERRTMAAVEDRLCILLNLFEPV